MNVLAARVREAHNETTEQILLFLFFFPTALSLMACDYIQCWQKHREFIVRVIGMCANGLACVFRVGGIRLYRTLVNRKVNSRASENSRIISLFIYAFTEWMAQTHTERIKVNVKLASICSPPSALSHTARIRRRWMTRKWIWWASANTLHCVFLFLCWWLFFFLLPFAIICYIWVCTLFSWFFPRKGGKGSGKRGSMRIGRILFSFAQFSSSKCYCFFISRHYHLLSENVNIPRIHTSYRVPQMAIVLSLRNMYYTHTHTTTYLVALECVRCCSFSISASSCWPFGTRHAPAWV